MSPCSRRGVLLGQFTSLSAWKVAQSGKDEGCPRVANDSDEHRQLNRRMEVVLKSSRPEEGKERKTALGGAAGVLPAPEGPVGKRPEGADVTIEGQVVRAGMEPVVRWQGYLMGSLLLSSPKQVSLKPDSFALTGEVSQYGWGGLGAFLCNMTLLEGATCHLVLDGARGDKHGTPLADYMASSINGGGQPTRSLRCGLTPARTRWSWTCPVAGPTTASRPSPASHRHPRGGGAVMHDLLYLRHKLSRLCVVRSRLVSENSAGQCRAWFQSRRQGSVPGQSRCQVCRRAVPL